jgi:hypothetical protein
MKILRLRAKCVLLLPSNNYDYFHYQRQNEHCSYAYNYEFVAVLYPSMFYNSGLLFFFITATFTEARMLSFQLPGGGQNTPIGFKDALMRF